MMELVRKMKLLFSSGIVKRSGDEKLQVESFGSDLVEALNAQPYGINAKIPDKTKVLVLSPNGERGRAVALLAINPKAPKASTGEVVIYNTGGALVRLKDDGSIAITGNISVSADFSVAGDLNVTGDISAEGEIKSKASIEAQGDIKSVAGDVVAGTVSLKSHTHNDSLGKPTSPPLPLTP